jgi:hypothetical protein
MNAAGVFESEIRKAGRKIERMTNDERCRSF